MLDFAAARGETGDGFSLHDRTVIRRSPKAYLQGLAKLEAGDGLASDGVATSCRWMVDADDQLVGELRLRRTINASLAVRGGHLGYFVHPARRGAGFGHALLAFGLAQLWNVGVDPVRVTCNEKNAASRRVIETAGGRLVGRSSFGSADAVELAFDLLCKTPIT